jgi:hypothetical protein
MDSQKAGNYANVGMFFIAILALIVSLATLGYMYWVRVYPDPEKVPPMTDTGALTTGWVPVIIVSASSLFSALVLLLATARRWKNKTLKSKVSDLEKDLEIEKAKVIAEKENLTNAAKEIKKLHEDLRQADLRENDQRGQKEGLSQLYNESQQKVATWAWLAKKAEDQNIEIDKHVVLEKITLGDLNLSTSVPTVRFGVYVMNRSVWDISLNYELKADVEGVIRFEDELDNIELTRPKRVINTVKDLPSGETGCLTIEQLLTPEQAKVIDKAHNSARAKFCFDELVVNVIGGDHSLNIVPKPLKLQNAFLTAYPVNRDQAPKRIAALSHVLGRAIQLHEPLRTQTGSISKDEFQAWESGARSILEKAYGYSEGQKIFDEISHGGEFPAEMAPAQTQWLYLTFAILEDLTSRQIQELTNRNTNSS